MQRRDTYQQLERKADQAFFAWCRKYDKDPYAYGLVRIDRGYARFEGTNGFVDLRIA
jgi:hypothetical protein